MEGEIVDQIEAVFEKNINSEAVLYSRLAQAVALFHKYYTTIKDEDILREAFDRPEHVNKATVDYALPGIEACLGVKTWFTKRRERTLLGEEDSILLLTIFGTQNAVYSAHVFYEEINMVIHKLASEFIEKHIFSLNGAQAAATRNVELNIARRVNARLLELARDYEIDKSRVEAAYANLKLKLVRTPHLTISTANQAKALSTG